MIPFFRELLTYTKCHTGALFFAQVIFWYSRIGKFYKCKTSCPTSERTGVSSWIEDLGTTRHKFDTVLKNVATRIQQGKQYNLLTDCNLVLYYTGNGFTYYFPNYPKLLTIEFESPPMKKHFTHFLQWKNDNPNVEKWNRQIHFSELVKLKFGTPLLKNRNNENNKRNNKKERIFNSKQMDRTDSILSKYQ